jgi:hypothetical protein
MKKPHLFAVAGLLSISVFLLSWGVTGHRAVGKIAEDHLTANAKTGVTDLLGSETLSQVSTWADEVRGQEAYRQTAPWHYINLPLGLSYAEFETKVKGMTQPNVYNALLEQERLITDPSVSKDKKTEALKFIVHFVGDLHQPMHVSREEDKGGNTIQLNYEGQGTNLHAVWDSKLIDHEGLDYEQLAHKVDQATPAQISQWQSDPLIKWIWESYEISSKLYSEVDAMKSRSVGQEYYDAHINIIGQRLEQAGIRLAGVLNSLFKNGPVTSGGNGSAASGGSAGVGGGMSIARPVADGAAQQPPVKIDVKDAEKHVNQNVIVTAKVYGIKALEELTLVNLGAAYPDQPMTVVLRGNARSVAVGIDGKTITVTGTVTLYKGKPEIVVNDPKMVTQ